MPVRVDSEPVNSLPGTDTGSGAAATTGYAPVLSVNSDGGEVVGQLAGLGHLDPLGLLVDHGGDVAWRRLPRVTFSKVSTGSPLSNTVMSKLGGLAVGGLVLGPG